MVLDTSRLRLGLLRHNENYVEEFDHLINAAIEAERLRALSNIRSIDEARINVLGGGVFFDVADRLGNLGAQMLRVFGWGAKAVGPYEELPVRMQSNLSTLRYTHRRSDHRKAALSAMKRTPDPGDFKVGPFSISLKPGLSDQFKDQIENKYTSESGKQYKDLAGRQAVQSFQGKVFPFVFQNLIAPVGANREAFVAYIMNFNESTSANWTETEFMSRSEPIYMYKGASRTFNLEFKLLATNNGDPLPGAEGTQGTYAIPDIEAGNVVQEDGYPITEVDFNSLGSALRNDRVTKQDMWRKANFLQSCLYPAYSEEGQYAGSPFLRFTLGTYFVSQLAILDSLTITYDPLIWDLNDEDIMPMIMTVSLVGKILHDDSPGSMPDLPIDFYKLSSAQNEEEVQ